ncbi:CGH_1_collapsed_G0027920.mRNA.1.CDS.1 [Saccharomyces cerevisiae]|nr:CGH_1_collapsed_G0027920.mRNA.1.CDS.1 [Saccharomyces cerevisiae]
MSFSVSSKTSKTTKLLVSSISESPVALIIITIRILFSIGKSDFKKNNLQGNKWCRNNILQKYTGK